MSEENKPVDGIDEMNEALSKTEQLIEQYQKQILTVVGVVAVVILAFFFTREYYFKPKEAKAQADLFKGEFYFQADSFNVALNGNGGDYIGFEAIIDENGSTKAGNLAKAYAGVSYMKLGEYEKAIDYLKSFSADDELVSPAIVGAIGDCYVELGKVKEAVNYFEKAASRADNSMISPIYLKKAGIAYESLKDYAGAAKVYQTIKDKYSASTEASDIEKYIERANLNK